MWNCRAQLTVLWQGLSPTGITCNRLLEHCTEFLRPILPLWFLVAASSKFNTNLLKSCVLPIDLNFLQSFSSGVVNVYLTIILRIRAEYLLILTQRRRIG